jgi:iron(III) transport system ATP-binding protein
MAQTLRREVRTEEVSAARVAAEAAPVEAAGEPGAPGAPDGYLRVDRLTKRYGEVTVLDEVSFGIGRGEFVCFLGPSGCGKTTLLMCLAGLEQANSGSVLRGGEPFLALPPSKRDVGIVFQSYALFPNLTVLQNIRFGLESQRKPAAEIRRVASELVGLLSLSGHEDKYPSQLSGGQQQRVALARALAVSPSLLLLDEPLSALDAQVRSRLRGELRDLQSRLGITTIMVTHDQEEAQSLADRIVLMNQGRIEQVGSPWEIYNRPASAFVADFIGVSNLFEGVVSHGARVDVGGFAFACAELRHRPGDRVMLLVRPEDVVLSPQRTDASLFAALVAKLEFLGALVRVHLRLDDGRTLIADLQKRQFVPGRFGRGESLWVEVIPADVKVLER